MSQRLAGAARKRRRLITYAWVSLLAIGTVFLIYKEQTAVLYILATLGVTALLVVVAVADLGGSKSPANDSPAGDAATSLGTNSTARIAASQSSAAQRK